MKRRGSPLRRAGRAGFLRNVAVALGNWGSREAVPALAAALSDPEQLVRGHAAWALGEIGSSESLYALEAALATEREPFVLKRGRRCVYPPTVEGEIAWCVRRAAERDDRGF